MLDFPHPDFDNREGLIEDFLVENPDLRFRSPNGVSVELIESFGYIELMIRVDPNTTMSSIRDSGSWILEWRDRIATWNRTRLDLDDNGENRLFNHLDHLHRNEDYSYRKIAELVNKELVDWIEKVHQAQEKLESNPGPTPEMNMESWREELVRIRVTAAYGVDSIRLVLGTLGFQDDEINLWIDVLSEDVKVRKSKLQLDKDPVDRDKIRNWLEHRRKRKNTSKGV